MPASGNVRTYQLPQDSTTTPFMGADDGSKFMPPRAFNITDLGTAPNQDGTTHAYNGDWGVHDDDVYTILKVPNWYVVDTSGFSNTTDTTITFSSTIHQLVLDNTRATTPLYFEAADVAASTSSVAVPAGGLLVLPVNTSKIHIYVSDHTKIQIRGQ